MKCITKLFTPKIDTSLIKFGFRLSTLLIFTTASSPVQAENSLTGGYTGLQYSATEVVLTPSTGPESKETSGHLKMKLGHELFSFVSLESQLGITTNSNSDNGIVTYGGYLRADYDLGEYRLYGLLGVGGIYAYNDVAADVSEASVSYGVGIDLFGSKDVALTFEYVSVVDTSIGNSDLTMESIGLGFTYYFNEDTSRFKNSGRSFKSIRP